MNFPLSPGGAPRHALEASRSKDDAIWMGLMKEFSFWEFTISTKGEGGFMTFGVKLVGSAFIVSLLLMLSGPGVLAFTYPSTGTNAQGETIQLDVPYVPTPEPVVEKMLEMAEVKEGETVYDLGSGDGRIVITAAKKFGAKGIGVDLDPERVREAKVNVKESKVSNLVEIREGDALKTDVSDADVITLYLLPSVNLKLKPSLQKLKPGTRIVSHDFNMGSWKPVQEETVDIDGRNHRVFKWIVGQGHGPDQETEKRVPSSTN